MMFGRIWPIFASVFTCFEFSGRQKTWSWLTGSTVSVQPDVSLCGNVRLYVADMLHFQSAKCNHAYASVIRNFSASWFAWFLRGSWKMIMFVGNRKSGWGGFCLSLVYIFLLFRTDLKDFPQHWKSPIVSSVLLPLLSFLPAIFQVFFGVLISFLHLGHLAIFVHCGVTMMRWA